MVTGTVSSMAAKISLLALSLAIYQVHAVVFKFEAEDLVLGAGQVNIRTVASNGKALVRGQLDKGTIYKTFCMKDAGDFQVLEVSVSNDGEKDIFEVFVDDVSYGTGESVERSNFGHMWDVFSIAGPFQTMRLDAGAHILKIVVRKTDTYGIEFDYIKVEAPDMQLSDFNCNVMCVNDDDAISSLTTNTDIRKAGVKVDLTTSTCPVNGNVKVRFYHNMATAYKLEAIRPNYRTFLNNGLEAMTECDAPVSTLWKYSGFRASPELDAVSIKLTSGTAVVSVKDSGKGASEIDVTFSLEGPNAGTYLSNIGSVLTVKVPQAADDLKITIRYKKGGNDNWIDEMIFTFTTGVEMATWNIPDFAWNEGQGNSIQLSIPHGVDVDHIELKKREEAGETVEVLWTSDAYVIEGVTYDFWWMSSSVMTVSWFNDATRNVKFYHYIRVKASLIPGADSQKTEIFTLYQDGRIRMVPLPAEGQTSVPFGSYAVIGEPDDSHVRPNSPIEHVELDVNKLEFKVSFYSGQVQLFLFILQDKTVLDVKLNEDFYTINPDHRPFMLIQSRYIHDGLSEIDHVAADGGVVKHLKDFSQDEVMNGTSFVFYRRCISHLNTQSERLLVHVLGPALQ